MVLSLLSCHISSRNAENGVSQPATCGGQIALARCCGAVRGRALTGLDSLNRGSLLQALVAAWSRVLAKELSDELSHLGLLGRGFLTPSSSPADFPRALQPRAWGSISQLGLDNLLLWVLAEPTSLKGEAVATPIICAAS